MSGESTPRLAPIERIADSLESVTSVILNAWEEQKAEDAKGNGEWVTEWFVRTHERGDIRCRDEGIAHETARYWFENSTEPESVDVFYIETQRWAEEIQERDWWRDGGDEPDVIRSTVGGAS